jgi:hypothetical protein
MTVNAPYYPLGSAGNGTTTDFGVPWPIRDPSDLVVEVIDAVTLVPISPPPMLNGGGVYDYQVVGTPDPDTGFYPTSDVILNSAPLGGMDVMITRATLDRQDKVFVTNGRFPAKSNEGALDRRTLVDQEQDYGLGRALQLSPYDTTSPTPFVLPPMPQRANTLLGFDGNGAPITTASSPAQVDAAVQAALNGLSGGTLGAIATTAALLAMFPANVAILHGTVFVTGARAVTGDGGGGVFFYDKNDTTTADNGGTVRVDPVGRRFKWTPMGGSPKGLRVSMYASLAQCDADATARGDNVILDHDVTLGADTVLNATAGLMGGGGIIHLNGHSLTVTGPIWGGEYQIIDCTGAGSNLVMLGVFVLKGIWLMGAYGDTTKDYSPGLQQAMNNIMYQLVPDGSGGWSARPGPRVLDLDSAGMGSYTGDGVYLYSTIVAPDGAYGGTVLCKGVAIVMMTDNIPIFQFNTGGPNNQTQNWSFLGDWATTISYANAQPPANTNAIMFKMLGNASADGHCFFTIDGFQAYNAYSFIATSGAAGQGFNGWWACEIKRISIFGGFSGIAIYHNPPAGGAERQHYDQLNWINGNQGTSNPAAPLLQVYNAGNVQVENVSIDGFGTTGAPAQNPALIFGSVQDLQVRQLHIEVCHWGASFGWMVYWYNCQGKIEGVEIATCTVANNSTMSFVYVVGVPAGGPWLTKLKIDDVVTVGCSVGATASQLFLVNYASGAIDQGMQITMGRDITIDSAFFADRPPDVQGQYGYGGAQGNVVTYEGQQTLEYFYYNNLAAANGAGHVNAPSKGGDSWPSQLVSPYDCMIIGVEAIISAALTAGVCYVDFAIDGTTQGTFVAANPGASYLKMASYYASRGSTAYKWKINRGSQLSVQPNCSGITPTGVNLQVRVTVVPLGTQLNTQEQSIEGVTSVPWKRHRRLPPPRPAALQRVAAA